MAAERRGSYRFRVEDSKARILSPSGPLPVRLLDLGAGGGGLALLEGMGGLPEGPLIFHLQGHQPFEAAVALAREVPGEERRIGIRFRELDLAALRSLSGFLIDRFEEDRRRLQSKKGPSVLLSSPEEIRGALSFHTIKHGAPLRAYQDRQLLPLVLRARELVGDMLVMDMVEGGEELLREGEEALFTFPGANAANVFLAQVRGRRPGQVTISLPSSIRRSGFRSTFRVAFGEDRSLRLSIIHPRRPGLILTKSALVAGNQGLAFPFHSQRDIFFPGEALDEICLHLPEADVRASALIRSMARQTGEEDMVGGMEITAFGDEAQGKIWKRYIFHAGHPRTILGGREQVGDLWRVLESSRYTEEATAELRDHLRKSFFVSWGRHLGHDQCGEVLLSHLDKRPVGTVAGSLIYPRTWMAHHFGVDESTRKADKKLLFEIARELYCGIFYVLNNMAPVDTFIIYADARKTWNEMVYNQFLQRYDGPEDFIFDENRVYKCALREERGEERGPMEIVDGSPEMLRLLSQRLRATLPALEFDAFCYDEREIDLGGFTHHCAQMGYERERRLFFALDRGEAVAALIAETGEEGINIFGLFNKCWFVALKEERAGEEHIKESLLRRALSYYRERGKKEFIFLGGEKGEPEDLLASLGFRLTAVGFRFLAKRTLLAPWMSHVNEIMRMLHG